jgi:hypothetical protein
MPRKFAKLNCNLIRDTLPHALSACLPDELVEYTFSYLVPRAKSYPYTQFFCDVLFDMTALDEDERNKFEACFTDCFESFPAFKSNWSYGNSDKGITLCLGARKVKIEISNILQDFISYLWKDVADGNFPIESIRVELHQWTDFDCAWEGGDCSVTHCCVLPIQLI